MASFLIVYGSGTGQTAKVARFIDGVLEDSGHTVTTTVVTDVLDEDVADYDAILVGSPVVNRAHVSEIVAFVTEHSAALRDRPTAFFQLSFASILPFDWAQSGAVEWVDALAAESDWLPDRIGLFPGVVRYTQYDRPTRTLFRLVSAVTTGDTDTSRDYEYTDWDEVEAFATEFAEFVESGEYERAEAPAAASTEGGTDTRTVMIGTPTHDGTVVEPAGAETSKRITRTLTRVAAAIGTVGIVYWLLGRRRSAEANGR